MRYYPVSGQSFKNYEPKRGWRGFFKRRRSLVRPDNDIVFAPKHRVEKKPLERPNASRFKIYFGVFLFLILAWGILLVALPFFRITEVSVAGSDHFIPADDVKTFAQGKITSKWWPKNNFFLVRPATLEKNILNKYPEFATVTVKKQFPNNLTIAINEKLVMALFDTGKALYLVDEKGEVIEQFKMYDTMVEPTSSTDLASFSTSTPSTTPEAPSSAAGIAKAHATDYEAAGRQYPGYLLLIDDQATEPSTTQKIISSEILATLQKLQWGVEDSLLGHIRFITIHGDGREGVRFYTDKPWYIVFNPLQDAASQIQNLQLVVRDKKPQQYVDVRFGDHVYWK
jgi:hypothetical protein